MILIYSNASSGETVTFKFYNIEEDVIYELSESIEFAPDMTFGNVMDPYFLTWVSQVLYSKDMPAGWNWLSLNVIPEDSNINTLVQNYLDENNDGYFEGPVISVKSQLDLVPIIQIRVYFTLI